jgi:hypothetical protein
MLLTVHETRRVDRLRAMDLASTRDGRFIRKVEMGKQDL